MDAQKTKLHKEHFDALWPSMLGTCVSHFKNKTSLFVPERNFDMLWAHELLADNEYECYQPPLKLFESNAVDPEDAEEDVGDDVCPDGDAASGSAAGSSGDHAGYESSSMGSSFPRMPPGCTPLPERPSALGSAFASMEQLERQRNRFKKIFENMEYPWYMDAPLSDNFKHVQKVQKHFITSLDIDILNSVQRHNSSFIIVDLGGAVCLDYLEHWLKFRCYVIVIFVVRCKELARQVLLLGKTYHSVYIEEASTWHDELNQSLHVAVKYARQQHIYTDCGQAFVFVFSHARGMSKVDTFKILRRH